MQSRVRTSLGRRPYLQQSVPFAVLAVGCTLTAIAVTTIATRERTATASAFRSDTLAVQRVVQVQLDTLASVTHAASALLAANPEINLVEFRAFIAELQLRERYPGLEGIGFAPRVVGTELRAFLRAASLDGVANLRVRPEGPRPEYFPAVLLDPPDTDNAAMIGFDLGSEDAQRDALDRARDSNAPAITPLLDANAPRRPRAPRIRPVYTRLSPGCGCGVDRGAAACARRICVQPVATRHHVQRQHHRGCAAFAGHRHPRQHRYPGTVAAHVRRTSCECPGDGAAVNRRPSMAADYGLS